MFKRVLTEMIEFICKKCGRRNTVNEELVVTWLCACGKWYDINK